MAKLTAAQRNALPGSEFGLPKQRKYPMNDREHQVLAKSYATKMVKQGKLSPAAASRIKAKADRLLGE
jgi:hypothetical protein